MKGHYNHIDEVFNLLNENKTAYLVLRNFEELENEQLFIQGHPDIDMLCEDSLSVVQLLGAFSCRKVTSRSYGDGTHYYIYVGDKYVSLDLRHIGDDYYCKKWEKDLLASREAYRNFYVPSREQLFHTLVYHAIFQKKVFSDDYRQRLTQMAKDLQLVDGTSTQSAFVRQLEKFMTEKSYRYVYPKDSCVPLMQRWQDATLVERTLKSFIPHFFFHKKVALIDFLVTIKHTLQR